MSQLVFLADIHNKGDAIAESLQNAGAAISEGSIAVLLEIDQGDEYLITKSEYSDTLAILCEEKINSEDYAVVKKLMEASDNSVYAFDAPGTATSVERQNGQREKIKKILNGTDAKGKDSVVVIDGIAHLQYQTGVDVWVPLQITPPPYPSSITSIKVGFPDGEDING